MCRLVCVFLIYVRVFSYCTAVRNKAQRVVMILLNRCLSRALCVFVCACVCVSFLCVCTFVVHQMRHYDITQQIFFRSICGVHVFVCVRLFCVRVCSLVCAWSCLSFVRVRVWSYCAAACDRARPLRVNSANVCLEYCWCACVFVRVFFVCVNFLCVCARTAQRLATQVNTYVMMRSGLRHVTTRRYKITQYI